MSTLISIERSLVRKVGGQEIRVDISNCFWCGNIENAICAGCVAKADNEALALTRPVRREGE